MLMKVKFTQSCPTLYEPMDSIVHGILQARILEWVAFPFSRGSLNPGIKPRSPALQADSLPSPSMLLFPNCVLKHLVSNTKPTQLLWRILYFQGKQNNNSTTQH